MDLANKSLKHLISVPINNFTKNPMFKLRWILFNLFFKNFYGLPLEFNPFLPGLEIKYALEEAKKLDSRTVFLGSAFDDTTLSRLKHETRNSFLRNLSNLFNLSHVYKVEGIEFKAKHQNSGFTNFVESNMDAPQMNWLIQTFQLLFPEYKRILIDKKEEDMFRSIVNNKSKRMVAVVNQLHMEGLEHHWCNAYGVLPRNMEKRINPIGDMSLRQMLYDQMYHAIMREIKSSREKSTPASYTNDINVYHREFNHHYEHRNM